MKIGRVVTDNGPKTVIEVDSKYYDLSELAGEDLEEAGSSFFFTVQKHIGRINSMVEQGKLSSVEEVVPNSYLVPVPHVNQIRDFYGFEEHVRNARRRRGLDIAPEWYEFPVYYYSGNSSLYPSDADVPYPKFTSELDFEIEIGAIIGKEGRNIPISSAWDHIFGFVLMNDWSARDQQRKEMAVGLGPSKSKDFATSMGRYMVTADEIHSRINENSRIDAEVWVSVNDSEYMRNNINTMHWSYQEMIAWASTETTLKPGDILMGGTVGRGCILELGPEEHGYLKQGDRVSFGSDIFGDLNSRIV